MILFVITCLGWPGHCRAQAPEARNPATDTLQPANASYRLPVTRIGTMGGQTLYVFLRESSSGQGPTLEFTWRHPLTLPRPKLVLIKLAQVRWVITEGKYYEPVRLFRGEAQLLALWWLAGPQLELFDVAWPKAKVISYVPIAGQAADLLARRDSSDYNHNWLLRRPGQQFMSLIPPKKKAFASFLAGYLANRPDLASAIKAQAEGYRYDDVPLLVRLYNREPIISK